MRSLNFFPFAVSNPKPPFFDTVPSPALPKGFTLEVVEQLPVWTTPGLRDAPPKLASLAGCSTKYLRFRTLTRVSKVLGNSRCFSVRSSSETWCVLQRFDSLPNIHWRGNSGRWFTRSMCFSKKWDDHPPFSHHLTVSFLWFWAWESPRKTEKSDDCAWNLELQ